MEQPTLVEQGEFMRSDGTRLRWLALTLAGAEALSFKCDQELWTTSALRGTYYRQSASSPDARIGKILQIPGVVVASIGHDPYGLHLQRSSALFDWKSISMAVVGALFEDGNAGTCSENSQPSEGSVVESNPVVSALNETSDDAVENSTTNPSDAVVAGLDETSNATVEDSTSPPHSVVFAPNEKNDDPVEPSESSVSGLDENPPTLEAVEEAIPPTAFREEEEREQLKWTPVVEAVAVEPIRSRRKKSTRRR